MCQSPETLIMKCQHRRKGRKCKVNLEYVGSVPIGRSKGFFEDWYCRKCNITFRVFVFYDDYKSKMVQ